MSTDSSNPILRRLGVAGVGEALRRHLAAGGEPEVPRLGAAAPRSVDSGQPGHERQRGQRAEQRGAARLGQPAVRRRGPRPRNPTTKERE